ncbi:MAG: hypothetical protein QRY16_01690 [Enterobacterales bacterium endosymbiont of Blomia tropicalis]|uniref:hypothetical protein n=1 Tax=Mixta mediterraneensis TaxID=2758443 RepID=UPI0025A87872|nr:hypothetical protein [Mixta mediterraneensis]MDL4912533.1 hypothetical protein [Mixta mediterraneensis]
MKKLLASILLILTFSVHAIPVELNNVPLREFVSWYSKVSGQPVIVSPDVKGEVTVYSADVKREELPQFFVSVLRANGYDLSNGNPGVVQKYSSRCQYRSNSDPPCQSKTDPPPLNHSSVVAFVFFWS